MGGFWHGMGHDPSMDGKRQMLFVCFNHCESCLFAASSAGACAQRFMYTCHHGVCDTGGTVCDLYISA